MLSLLSPRLEAAEPTLLSLEEAGPAERAEREPMTDEEFLDLVQSSDTTELTVPATVTVPQGETSATFDLTVVGDSIHREAQTVTVTASAAGWTPGSAEMDVVYKAVTPFAGGCAAGAGRPPGLLAWTLAAALARAVARGASARPRLLGRFR